MDKNIKIVNDKLAGKIEIAIAQPAIITRHPNRRRVDLRKIGIREAEKLIDEGHTFLKKIDKKPN